MLLERRYGMPRGALQYADLRELGYGAPGRVHDHIASPWGVLARILPRRQVTRDDVFLEIGCGVGAVLVEAAARYDFRRAIGIDIVPQFTEAAEQTIARGRDRLRCRDVEVVTGDVTEYAVPDDVTVVFMFDPVRGELFDAVIASILASVDRNPRRIRLVYYHPIEGGRLELTGRARPVRLGRRRGHPWTTSPDLAMYEIGPGGAGRVGARPRRLLPRRLLRKPPEAEAAGARAPTHPTIQAGSRASGTKAAWVGNDADLEALRAAFGQDHCVRLQGFLDDALLERLRAYADDDQDKASALLFLLVSDPELFKLVRSITGCRRIGRFEGDLLLTPPGPEHAERWHGDIFGHGMVSLDIDLSAEPYSGGALELRDRHTEEQLCSGRTDPGDALLTRVAPFLQERLTAVEGDLPRRVYRGRFMLSREGEDSKLAEVGRPAPSPA
jgi:SAM-dependent methyltransferase